MKEEKKEKILLGSKIRALRLQAEMKQDEFAEKLGKNQSFVSDLEKGKKIVTYELLLKIAKLFNIGLDYFDPRGQTEKQINDMENQIKTITEVMQQKFPYCNACGSYKIAGNICKSCGSFNISFPKVSAEK